MKRVITISRKKEAEQGAIEKVSTVTGDGKSFVLIEFSVSGVKYQQRIEDPRFTNQAPRQKFVKWLLGARISQVVELDKVFCPIGDPRRIN